MCLYVYTAALTNSRTHYFKRLLDGVAIFICIGSTAIGSTAIGSTAIGSTAIAILQVQNADSNIQEQMTNTSSQVQGFQHHQMSIRGPQEMASLGSALGLVGKSLFEDGAEDPSTSDEHLMMLKTL